MLASLYKSTCGEVFLQVATQLHTMHVECSKAEAQLEIPRTAGYFLVVDNIE
jgi:hypothetical protein